MTPELHQDVHLPHWEDRPNVEDLEEIGVKAMAAYARIRTAIEAKYPRGWYIVIDGSDPTGKSYTVGSDVILVQEQHYRDYPEGFATSLLLTVGRD